MDSRIPGTDVRYNISWIARQSSSRSIPGRKRWPARRNASEEDVDEGEKREGEEELKKRPRESGFKVQPESAGGG